MTLSSQNSGYERRKYDVAFLQLAGLLGAVNCKNRWLIGNDQACGKDGSVGAALIGIQAWVWSIHRCCVSVSDVTRDDEKHDSVQSVTGSKAAVLVPMCARYDDT